MPLFFAFFERKTEFLGSFNKKCIFAEKISYADFYRTNIKTIYRIPS